MPRAAGNDPYYTWVLKRANGRYDQDVTIKLPSVTTIISATLAKPQLIPWVYRQTRDVISGLAQVAEETWGDGSDLMDTLTDADMLEEYLKENRLRPEDTTRDAANRGTENHEMLELLCKAYLAEGEESAATVAQRILNRSNSSGWARGISGWWLDTYPAIVSAEDVMFSLKQGFAGTVDMVYEMPDGSLRVCDLKTRGEGKTHYRTDHVQVDGYADAFEEMTGLEVGSRSALIVTEDGKFEEAVTTIPRGTFLKVKEVYDLLKGVR